MDYVEANGVETAIVDVYLTVDDSRVHAIKICESSDFSAYCWEKDSYNIWVEYSDETVSCYTLNGKKWKMNTSAAKPEYIASKED